MPHSALTRWLKQGLARGMCPLCRAAHKLDREYMWHFFDERSSNEDALDEVAASRGICAAHAEQLRRIEVDGLGSTIAISAGDVPGALAGEQDDEVRDLLGRAGRLAGNVVGRGALRVRDAARHPMLAEPQPSRHRPRADGVDADPCRRHLLRQRLGEVREGGLGGAVVDDRGVGEEGVDRARRDDAPAPSVEHSRDDRARGPHRGHEREVERRRPFVVGDGGEAIHPGRHRTDVVDEDVDRAVREGGVDELGRPARRREIDLDRLDHACLHKGAQLVREAARAGNDRCAFGRERVRHGEPDSLAGASHQRALAAELGIHGCRPRPYQRAAETTRAAIGSVKPSPSA
jgi:hypothetical protein